jgi:hypothetical protein
MTPEHDDRVRIDLRRLAEACGLNVSQYEACIGPLADLAAHDPARVIQAVVSITDLNETNAAEYTEYLAGF